MMQSNARVLVVGRRTRSRVRRTRPRGGRTAKGGVGKPRGFPDGGRGRVLLVGGSEDFVGAPYLAGISALRSGAESVIVMAPERVAWAINALSPDLMTRKLKGSHLTMAHAETIKKQAETADILVLGNGVGMKPATEKLMRFLMRLPMQKVIDADALKALRSASVQNAILTPNEGEWRSLETRSDIRALLNNKNIIVKKGFPTKILAKGRTIVMQRTNRGLRKAGTGDVLAGLIAGYLAQGLSLIEAAQEACTTGNAIADVLTKKKKGYYFLASDIAKELSSIKARAGALFRLKRGGVVLRGSSRRPTRPSGSAARARADATRAIQHLRATTSISGKI